MKKLLCAALCLCLLLVLCACDAPQEMYVKTWFGLFDTVVILKAYAPSKSVFDETAEACRALLEKYHRWMDIYHAYDGLENLYTVNARAAEAPVEVSRELMDYLLFCKRMQRELPKDSANVAMGAVLSLWHDARERGVLPDESALTAAAAHIDFDDVVLDERARTVRFADSALKLDAGASGKGYAAQKAADLLSASALSSFVLSAGGNVVCGGAPKREDAAWRVSVQDPDSENALMVLRCNNVSIVTSGDYQTYFTVDGVNYHHIIDPTTLYPARHARSVTVITKDSGMADYLSTVLFVLPTDRALALASGMPGVEALLILPDGSREMTAGFNAYIQP